MKVKNLFLIAAGVFMLTTTFTATAKKLPKEVKMTKEVLMDKIKAAARIDFDRFFDHRRTDCGIIGMSF